jgi:hypothetical protein
MAPKTRKISTLVEQQLPGFISSEYVNFSKFVEKYYEQLESQGQPIDIISNITKYRDIDFYEENLLNQYTTLVSNISDNAASITVLDATSFPKENGYIRINNEICFYKSRTDTEFLDVSRGVSGNTTLGDLYSETTFVSTESASHEAGQLVYNVSNLFLYAFIKNFESQYLGAFPEKYLKGQVDKRTLIKNISKFYKAKGTDKSIKFIFNSIVSRDAGDIPEVYNPKDSTIKASTSDWVSTYSLKVKFLSGDPLSIIGERLSQALDETKPDMLYASAIVDNVIFKGSTEEGDIYEIILDPATINGTFEIASKTTLRKSITTGLSTGQKINVGSTMGWKSTGKILIGNEVIKYNAKNATQFVVDQRGTPPSAHFAGDNVYSFSTVTCKETSLLTLGILYNLNVAQAAPYSEEKDAIQISDSGFETRDPIIFNKTTNNVRWIINESNLSPSIQSNVALQNAVSEELANVSAIYEDDQYYYICSSGYPSHDILSSEVDVNLVGQNLLRLIRKNPTTTTEVYSTGNRDVGIFVDGTLVLNHKDSEFVNFGKITKITVTKNGTGYKNPPFVLINDQPKKANASLSGEVLESIAINTTESFTRIPSVTITSGRGAKVDAVVTSGKITSLIIRNPGEYYSSPPVIRITDLAGRGKFADYTAVISPKGQLVDFIKVDEGKFYTKENVVVEVIEDARGTEASAFAEIEKWSFDRLKKNELKVDDSYGYVVETYDSINRQDKDYVYGRIANPTRLRILLNDNLNSAFNEPSYKTHSPILGFAYDGVPIYGPFGYQNPTDSSSLVVRLSSGYQLKSSRLNGPSVNTYPLGTFIEDYEWKPSVNTGRTELDENNGRFCVTPDYPNGVYAYFLTVNSSNVPVFPYILGKNYYSLPVDSNYNSNISQNDLPVKARRLRTPELENNGSSAYAYIESVKTGGVSGATVEDSHNNFKVGSVVRINNSNTEGSGAAASVASVVGKNVLSLETKQTKATEIKTLQTAYYFEGDTITQPSTGAVGTLIGNVINNNQLVLRDVSGSFEPNEEIESTINVINLVLSQNSSFTAGSVISLSNGIDDPVATGLVLETTNNQNSLKLKVLTGNFLVDNTLFLKSGNLNDTVGSKIIILNSLSIGIVANTINDNIAIVETDENHNLTIGDKVIIDVNPDDSLTETEYYVRKRYYQKVTLKAPRVIKKINDLGLGRYDLLNSGVDYSVGTYTNVELVFQNNTTARNEIGLPGDPGNARATIIVSGANGSNYGGVVQVIITNKGTGYRKGDILTVADDDLNRLVSSVSTQRLTLLVDHVGFAKENTELKLNSIVSVSNDDLLQIGDEIVKVTSVNEINKSVFVVRGQNQTRIVDHYNGKEISSLNARYRFTEEQRIKGDGLNDPYVSSYDEKTQELTLVFDYSSSSPNQLLRSNTFYDASSPRKLVTISSTDSSEYRLEFSKDNTNFAANPVVQIQKYYKYRFDVSHFSMTDTYLDFSSSSNYNVFTEEKFVSSISPGNPGSYLSIKLGFGPNISTNTFEQKKPINFTNYFYFIKVSDVNTQNSYLQVVDDPLTGEKEVVYSTDTKFVYNLSGVPEYDGTGTIDYTTSSKFAIGKINSILIENFGDDYRRVPTVYGIDVAEEYEAKIDVIYDAVEKKIKSIAIIDGGSNYSKPKAIVVDGDGSDAQFEVSVDSGAINRVTVRNEGRNYSYLPTIKIIETDVKVYFSSNNIGIPQTVSIVENGYAFHNDKTLYPEFKSPTTLLLEDVVDNAFAIGEKVVQYDNGNIIFSAVVAKNGFRPGSNILRLEKINGVIDKSLPIKGTVKNNTATIKAVLSTVFAPDIRTFFDNQGRFASDKGKIGVSSQKITDSFFYQDYSYVIKSKTPISVWRDLIKETVHPAGFKLFGEVAVESDGNTSMPSEIEANKTESVTFINLGAKNISVIGTRRYVTESFVNLNAFKVERGLGSISVDTFDNSETIAGEFILSTPFNGRLDSYDGQPIGNTVFTLIDKKSGLPIAPYNEQQLIITLDGVLQEPGEAYTVSGTQITFSYPPFGPNTTEGQYVTGQKFYGRYFKFKTDDLNFEYLRKLRSIESEFDGVNMQFDLYYDNNDIVKTDKNENLIITLNSIVQKAKSSVIDTSTEELNYLPEKNSYYILRSDDPDVTDKIVFSDPPIKHSDIDENTEPQLSGRESSFGYTIGSYLRLKINNDLIEYRRTGPFLIIDEITQRVKKIDNSKYALVFIDGVLQVEGESYRISGPTITFTKPLNYFVSESGEAIYPDVNIILLYGRDIAQSLTVYDFEKDTFYNKLTLTITGSGTYTQFINWYGPVGTKEIWVYQNNKALGKLRAFRKATESQWNITLSSQNVLYNSNYSLKFSTHPGLNDPSDLTISGPYQLSTLYEQNTDGDRLLSRSSSRYLYGSELADKAWYEQTRSYANLHPGDLIKIDGEKAYREVSSIPAKVKTKDYRYDSFVSNNVYSKIFATNYNDIVRGEGLAVIANIANGKVVSLDWNKRELELYFKYNLLLQPTAYQYYTPPILQFIPNDKTGGGARAEVIVYDGQVIDLKLLDGGSGYIEAPTVVVSRGYDIIKDPNRKIDSFTELNLNIEITGFVLTFSSSVDIQSARIEGNVLEIISFGGPTDLKIEKDITAIIQPITNVGLENKKLYTELYVSGGFIRPVEFSSIVSTDRQITNIIDVPFDVISRSTVTSTDRQITKNITKVVNNSIIETAPYSINDVGAFLDLPLTETDTIVYIPDTSRFPDSSRLLIGKEIVTYNKKLSDRFLDVARGTFGTTATTHNAGDYLRHLPELVTVVSAGPTTEIITEVTVSQISTTYFESVRSTQVLYDDTPVVTIQDTATNIISIEQIDIQNTNSRIVTEIVIAPPDSKITSFVTTIQQNGTEYVTGINSVIDTYQQIYSSSIQTILANSIETISSATNTIVNTDIEILKETAELISQFNNVISSSIVSEIDVPVSAYTFSKVITTNVAKNADIEIFRKFGVLDYFEETVVLYNPIKTRLGEVVIQEPENEVTLRNASTLIVINKTVFREDFYNSYQVGNAGLTLKSFQDNMFVDTGTFNSGMTLLELSLAYPSLTLNDFVERPTSAITLTGDKFNMGIPSIQNPVVYAVGSNLSSSPVIGVVGNTSAFPITGYLLQVSSGGQYTVIQYTGKTTSTFTGCTVINGTNIINAGNQIIPYSV